MNLSVELHRFFFVCLLTVSLCLCGCGYRLQGSAGSTGDGRTLAIPVFLNESSTFRVEQRLTEAVRRELIRSTRFRVVPDEGGDVVLAGRVLDVTTAPTVFTDQGRAIVYTVAVVLNVRLTDSSNGAVLFEDPRVAFRESFEVSNDSAQFVPEDPAAMERLARQFASWFASSLSRVMS
jgi:outer membrane lipopolysaccharide assembly protein LptE/RlpB